MRQAGRSLPEYREIRVGRGMLESCFDPELVCEITMQPVRRHGVDAAILFSDIVVPLKAAGVDLDIVSGVGPVIAHPIRTHADVRALPLLTPDAVGAVSAAVKLLKAELGETALIGFAGAPFTLASYLIEGGPSRNYENTKALMYGQPAIWHELVGKLADITIAFLKVQLDAGVDAFQLFDSWAGALSVADYNAFARPHSARVFAELASYDVPRIHFGVGTGELLHDMGTAGATWSGSTGGSRSTMQRGGSDPAGPFRETSIRPYCSRRGRWWSKRSAASPPKLIERWQRGLWATSSTSVTGFCPPPTRPC